MQFVLSIYKFEYNCSYVRAVSLRAVEFELVIGSVYPIEISCISSVMFKKPFMLSKVNE